MKGTEDRGGRKDLGVVTGVEYLNSELRDLPPPLQRKGQHKKEQLKCGCEERYKLRTASDRIMEGVYNDRHQCGLRFSPIYLLQGIEGRCAVNAKCQR